jgi:hypothetical protein
MLTRLLLLAFLALIAPFAVIVVAIAMALRIALDPIIGAISVCTQWQRPNR